MNREPIVIDTNVLISFALSSTTTPALAVEYAINNFIILQSPATICELVTKILQRYGKTEIVTPREFLKIVRR